ncbi:MAG TPA: response regulator transcription factor [Syntrophorhabdaceae bacterium]|nr:response regulator transcription factor [Syntrophorhabdaceae bacterium]HQK45840.1 response regulator transcription factor [Syntrophorhabdaceae bacterium]
MRDRKGKNIRVVLAEDHTLVRKGIKALLEELEGIDVVAEAGDGHEAINAVETSSPDIVLLDIAMPGLNGLEVASRITKDFPDTKVIVLSMHANEEYVFQSLKAGVAGYLLKDAGTAELELAIRSVIRGEIYLSPQISKQVVTDYMARTEGKTRAGQSMDSNPFEVLTSRQREILQLIAEGYTTKEIAKRLNISINTVEAHRTQIMEQLDIHNIAGLVRYAIRTKLVE